MTTDPVQHAKAKHIEIDIYFMREQVQRIFLQVSYIPSYYQKADILTKALSSKNFTRLREELNIKRSTQPDLKPQERQSSNSF